MSGTDAPEPSRNEINFDDEASGEYRTTPQFDRLVEKKVPPRLQKFITPALDLYAKNPAHPSLHAKPLKHTKKGRHARDSVRICITNKYRAIGVCDDDAVMIWYWIGSHNDYENFIGRK